MSRTEVVKVLLSPEEKAKAEQLAAAQGLSVSSFLRRCVILTQLPKPTNRAA
jgi:hypothetical protein